MNWSEKNVLITGGSGFLGSFLIEQLNKKNVKNLVTPTSKDYDLRNKIDCKNVQWSATKMINH